VNHASPNPLDVGPVDGRCDARFERVRDVFAENFVSRGESGAAITVVHNGQTVVDLWGGVADHHHSRPWKEDSLQLVFSTTKGFAAATVLSLVESGELDIDAPVADVWPEFGAAGKATVTTRQVLSHRAGVPAFAERISPEECHIPGFAAARLASQTSEWEPGTAHGYHSLSLGFLLGEIVQRVSGRSLGTVWRERFGEPLGLDSWIGLPAKHEHRVTRLRQTSIPMLTGPDEGQRASAAALVTKGSLTRRVFANPKQVGIFNDAALHAAEWPAANGITTARSLAAFYASLLDGRGLSQSSIARACEPQSAGFDLVSLRESRFGLGFALAAAGFGGAPGNARFGHAGAGGSVGFADPETGIAFAYVMTQMHTQLTFDPRRDRLIAAVYDALR
jgi:CubicO group peptidase (beta-lactamase class C family)